MSSYKNHEHYPKYVDAITTYSKCISRVLEEIADRSQFNALYTDFNLNNYCVKEKDTVSLYRNSLKGVTP